jgi:hypothetical protein
MSPRWRRAEPGVTGRFPDFIIIGAMKGGSTTLFRWLDAHSGTRLPHVKEPGFFCDDVEFERGPERYRRLFPTEGLTGEASVAYSDPVVAPQVAARIAQTAPDVRLIFLARNPVARLRSHYLHESLRGRERRSLAEAVALDGNPYVRRSCYKQALAPFVQEIGRESLLVVQSELLDQRETWAEVQRYLGLSIENRSTTRHNVSSAKQGETRVMQALRHLGLVQPAMALPPPLRRLGRRVVLRDVGATRSIQREAQEARIPLDVTRRLKDEADGLAELVGWERNPWFRDDVTD